jgi:hypothetical protein
MREINKRRTAPSVKYDVGLFLFRVKNQAESGVQPDLWNASVMLHFRKTTGIQHRINPKMPQTIC